jgi:lipopolysaccharide transport system permease protein
MLNPLLMMLVLYFVFSNVFKMAQEHFALYLLIGITDSLSAFPDTRKI